MNDMTKVPAGYRRVEKSERRPAPGARRVGPADPKEVLSVSIRLRRRPDAPALPDVTQSGAMPARDRTFLSRQDFVERYGAAQEDLDRVTNFARSNGLIVVETSIPRRTVVVSGTVEQMGRAFAVELGRYESPTQTYRGREGYVHLPSDLADIVEGVFGLDNRQMARRLNVRATGPAQATTPLTPPAVAQLYDFPTTQNATGQTIGLLEFGGGYRLSDIQAFFNGLGPGFTTPALTAVGVDGASNSPGSDADTEVALDIDVAGSVAQGANIAVYFAPWTEQGWVDVVTTAVHDTTNTPSTLSISWGWPEFETINGLTWTAAAIDAVSATFQEASLLGLTVFAASGDSGSSCGMSDNKAHVLYPASDPWVTTCGGTTISNVSGSSFAQGTWPSTGGGISDSFPLPYWQTWAGVPPSVNDGHLGRGIPDVAGNADPNSGYTIVVGGSSSTWGGTSAVAPLYAALVALLNARLAGSIGYLNYNLYAFAAQPVYKDIADGQSNATGGAPGYTSGPGWDACTGWGSIDGNSFLTALEQEESVVVVSWGANRLDIFGLGRDRAMYHKAWDGSAWLPTPLDWDRLGGVFTSPPAVASWGPNRLDIFGRGGDGAIYHKAWDGSEWLPTPLDWDRLGGVFTSLPAVASWGPNRLDIFGLGRDGAMYHKAWDGSQWLPTLLDWDRLGGVFTSPPAVASWVANRLDIFGLGGDGAMYHKAWDGSEWLPTPLDWDRLGGVFTSPPAVASWGPNRLDIFGLGRDRAMYHKAWDGSQWLPTPLDWDRLGGVFTSPPAVASWGPNRLDIFGLGRDGAMYHKAWDGSQWLPTLLDWDRLGGVFTSQPAVASWGANRLDIFGLGGDRAMYHKAWDGSQWLPTPLDWERLGGVFLLVAGRAA